MAPSLRKRSRPTENTNDSNDASSSLRKKRQKKFQTQDDPQSTFPAQTNGKSNSEGELNKIFDLITSLATNSSIADRPILYYPNTGTEYTGYTPKDLYSLALKAASYYSASLPPCSGDDQVKVIGLLGRSTLEYLVMFLGLSRLGHAVLFLSPRISREAVEKLVRECKAEMVLVEEGYRDMAMKLKAQVPASKIHDIVARKDYDFLPEYVPNALSSTKDSERLAYILHSSGSTSLPKPISKTHSQALSDYKSTLSHPTLITLPLFHAQGIGWLFRTLSNHQPVYLYPGTLPLTTANLVKTLRAHPEIKMAIVVPWVLGLLAESEEVVELARRLEVVLFGGASCTKHVGDRLANGGVFLVSQYGSSETGQLLNSSRPRSEVLEWDWLKPLPSAEAYLRFEEQEEKGLFEMVVLPGWPSLVAGVANRGDGKYATSDLWERHPDWPRVKKWRYYGRKDDSIVLLNGEKASPILFEEAACSSPLVQEAIVFGNGKHKLGIFVLHVEGVEEGEVVEYVWPLVEKVNLRVEGHAQISKDMIKILDPKDGERMRRTDKGNIIRSAFYSDFQDLIDAAYEEFNGALEKVAMGKEELLNFLRREIENTLAENQKGVLGDDTDLFALGIDSLQASRIRSAILRHGIDTGNNTIGENFVFEFPSIRSMAEDMIRMRTGGEAMNDVDIDIGDQMQALIEKYGEGFERHFPVTEAKDAKKVIITGTTGSLGVHLLAQVGWRDDIDEVICLVRNTSDEKALQRVQDSVKQRWVDVNWNRVTAYASDLSDPHLGLDSTTYENLTKGLKCIIHSAWPVNFNLNLASFEDSIAGARHLLDLCLRAKTPAPAEFVFCSSISVVSNSESTREIPEELFASPKAAQASGYARSKLIAEHICMNAAETTGLKAKVLRIGQVAGDSKYGIWNSNEAIPMMLQSAKTVGCLPMLDEWHSWLPVDTCAKIISEISFSPADGGVYNVVNPKSFHWTWDLLLLLRENGFAFEAVAPTKWLQRLRSVSDPEKNPAIKLIKFFAAKYGSSNEGERKAVFATDKAGSASGTLKHMCGLEEEWVGKVASRLLDG